MSTLEDMMGQSNYNFDTEPLPDGHEKKFDKLLRNRLHNNLFVIRMSVTIAASVLIFIGTSIYIYKIKKVEYSAVSIAHQSVEFTETEQYFSQQTGIALDHLKAIMESQSAEVSKSLFQEIGQMDVTYNQLRNELKDNPNDPRIMGAIIQYYQVKIELINNLSDKFTLYTHNKLKQHENEPI